MAATARELARVVTMYLGGEIGFDEFEAFYSGLFLDEMPEGQLSDAELDLYGSIIEKLSWTSASPTDEERELGWIDRREFRLWLKSISRSADGARIIRREPNP